MLSMTEHDWVSTNLEHHLQWEGNTMVIHTLSCYFLQSPDDLLHTLHAPHASPVTTQTVRLHLCSRE